MNSPIHRPASVATDDRQPHPPPPQRRLPLIRAPASVPRPTDRPCARTPPPARHSAARPIPLPAGWRSARSRAPGRARAAFGDAKPSRPGSSTSSSTSPGRNSSPRPRPNAVVGFADDVESFGLQKATGEAPKTRMVVDDQDAAHHLLIFPPRSAWALRVNPGIAPVSGFHRGVVCGAGRTSRRSVRTASAASCAACGPAP